MIGALSETEQFFIDKMRKHGFQGTHDIARLLAIIERLTSSSDGDGPVPSTLAAHCGTSPSASRRGGPSEETCEDRARKIVTDEERFAAADRHPDIQLHALRWARYGTAKQILGELPMTEPSAPTMDLYDAAKAVFDECSPQQGPSNGAVEKLGTALHQRERE